MKLLMGVTVLAIELFHQLSIVPAIRRIGMRQELILKLHVNANILAAIALLVIVVVSVQLYLSL